MAVEHCGEPASVHRHAFFGMLLPPFCFFPFPFFESLPAFFFPLLGFDGTLGIFLRPTLTVCSNVVNLI